MIDLSMVYNMTFGVSVVVIGCKILIVDNDYGSIFVTQMYFQMSAELSLKLFSVCLENWSCK